MPTNPQAAEWSAAGFSEGSDIAPDALFFLGVRYETRLNKYWNYKCNGVPIRWKLGRVFPNLDGTSLMSRQDLAASGAGVNRVSGEKLPAEWSSALAAGVGRNAGQRWRDFEE